MANNPYVNKVVYGGQTLIDISSDTVDASHLANGYTAHNASGSSITGTAHLGSAYQDSDGYVILESDESDAPQGSLSITENGTYAVSSYAGVNVDVEPNLLSRNVEISTSEQTITAQSKILTGGDTLAYGNRSSATDMTRNLTPYTTLLSVGMFLRLSGTIIITGEGGITLEEHSVSADNFKLLNNTSGTTIRIEDSEFINSFKLYFLSDKLYIRLDINAGLYGWVINLDIYPASRYEGIDSATIPAGYDATIIKNFIARSSSFNSFEFPNGITKIGDYSFGYCTSLVSANIPNTVTTIGTYAFYNCPQLKLTSLPSGATVIGGYAFYECGNITLTSLPSGITRIDNYTFYGCRNITFTSLPSGITYIGMAAFSYCINLAITSLPSSVTYIGGNAFQYCNSITSIHCDGAITTMGANAFQGNGTYPMALQSASFPNMALTNSLGSVFGASTAAYACQQLAFVDIGSTAGISASSFANCYSLQTLVLRKTSSVCTLGNVSAFTNTPMRGYNGLTGTVYVPSALISSYQTATNWSTLYNDGTVTFVAIEGSEYELD